MRKNLISLKEVDMRVFHWKTADEILTVEKSSNVIMKTHKRKIMYILKGFTILGEVIATTSLEYETWLWHACLGHMNEKDMNILHKQNLLPSLRSCKLEFCEYCVFEKHTQHAFRTDVHSSKRVLEYVDIDVWGPFLVVSHYRKEYHVTFIDDYSRYMWIYFLRDKYDVFVTFKKWRAQLETKTRGKMKFLQSNNG